MCMAAKAQCMKTCVLSAPIAAGITPAWQGRSGPPPSPTTPPHGAMQRGRRRRGKSGGPPRPREQIRLRQGPVSARKLPRQIRLGPLNLFHSAQTKSCLGHCITRGLGLRRQATILRLRGAVLFRGGPAAEFGRACGVRMQCSARISAVLTRGKNPFVTRWNMELCGSAPVIAEERGRIP